MGPIVFNKPHYTGRETLRIIEAVDSGKISGDGIFTKKCHNIFTERYRFRKTLLTTSCTDALEMAALLTDIKPGDEVIMPSFTFVSTANAFCLRHAKVVFADSRPDHPGMDEDAIEPLITDRTRAIVPVHYAGVACNMDLIMALAEKHGLYVIEDAAQAIDSYHTGKDGTARPLGSIGHLSTFSFHETKNLQCGEGGALIANDPRFADRAEIVWEKGTDRAAFWRGEVDKYGWVDIGSSFLPSELTAAYLFAQLQELDEIQRTRKGIWDRYHDELKSLFAAQTVRGPHIPEYATNNAHMFYLVCGSTEERSRLIDHLKRSHIGSVFHYQSLHASAYYRHRHDGRPLPWSDIYSDRLLRLPMHTSLRPEHVAFISERIRDFYG